MTSEQQIESNALQSEDAQVSREQAANLVISKYTGWAAGSGVIPFPFWDVAAIAAVEIKMVNELLDIYDKPFSESKTRSILTILIGSLSPQLLVGVTAATLFKVIPGIGSALSIMSMPILAAASAYAVGQVMVNHLKNGGDLTNFDPKAKLDDFKAYFKEGKKKVDPAATT
ncbi:MAG: DUF697 domain-containing protein [Methylobacter tundripaludum]|uniref:YcjF family protein n=1 Tax=Methylobacter tundripaludum TaxID=173365 RepID=UPI0015E2C31C|nr:DUF697 domain-containing protein [Methylobacter tundripaludum]MCK9637301.1 DUF697 domain-containing protein [Methylobacter tundripaludum]